MTNRRTFIRNTALTAAGISLLKSNAIASLVGEKGLKDFFKDDFLVGTAIGDRAFTANDTELLNLIAKEFNVLTPENVLKWEPVNPKENEWRFEAGDRLVEFAQKNSMAVQGHCLVWHSQVPRDLFTDESGNQISKEGLTKRMETHIQTLVDRYKGKIRSWDVVNESITPEDGYRKSKWFEIMGPEFMERAFYTAHEVDPNCKLIYNDYGMDDPKRRDFVVELVKQYKKKGVPIHGIGMQGHYNLDNPDISAIEASIEAFASTGVPVSLTELDVDVLPYDWGRTAEISTNVEYKKSLNPYTEGLPKEINDKLTKRYEELFKLFLKHRDKIDRITFWGASDDLSWKNGFPMRGRTNYPLLFDRQRKAKDAYFAVTGLKK
jgi:endo-1,4-beta-xylanase